MLTETLKLDPDVIQKLRDHTFKKHGKLYGNIKAEAEAGILAWVEADKW